jgi:uncharacterized cysteine cluster protein YcgN (CxxCxxCC family)
MYSLQQSDKTKPIDCPPLHLANNHVTAQNKVMFEPKPETSKKRNAQDIKILPTNCHYRHVPNVTIPNWVQNPSGTTLERHFRGQINLNLILKKKQDKPRHLKQT